ncbi:hypothetical protein [Hirschia baltica]|uniref:Uncharacterized protein n=1 Tax=Hirschia baltica (strain ATCC 49814 / DSM 5838 / IFAM 1418) TaxID=582402 RepID=C6XRH0_HIRBI|nr:hypothetical protein [Hirschia baltica]ACT58802.1 hypothetical protein Hbal_1110 [Hirschia baltica ATCC 49814]
MRRIVKSSIQASICLGVLVIAGCETTSDETPLEPLPVVESVEIEEVPDPVPVEPDLSLGPMPKTKPVEKVDERDIPPAKHNDGTVIANSATPLRAFPEKGDLAGITQAHTYALQAKGASGLEWSESLAQRASLQVQQISMGMCGAKESKILSARGEAIYLVPAGLDSQGQARIVNVSVRKMVADLMQQNAGAFSKENSGSMILGCAVNKCVDESQIWMCLYK